MKQEGRNMNLNSTQLSKFPFTKAQSWRASLITINVVIAVPKCSQTMLSLYLCKQKHLDLCVNAHIFYLRVPFFLTAHLWKVLPFFKDSGG